MKISLHLVLSFSIQWLLCIALAAQLNFGDYNTGTMKPLRLYLISRQPTCDMSQIDTETRYVLGEFSSRRHFILDYDWLSALNLSLAQGASKYETYLLLSSTLSTDKNTAIYLDNEFHSNFSDLFITCFTELYRDSTGETAIALNLESHYLIPYSSEGTSYGLIQSEIVFRKMIGSRLSIYLGHTHPLLLSNPSIPYMSYRSYPIMGLDYWMDDGYSLACHYNGQQWIAGAGLAFSYYYFFAGASLGTPSELKFCINLVY